MASAPRQPNLAREPLSLLPRAFKAERRRLIEGCAWGLWQRRGGWAVGVDLGSLGAGGKPFREHLLIAQVFIEPLFCWLAWAG